MVGGVSGSACTTGFGRLDGGSESRDASTACPKPPISSMSSSISIEGGVVRRRRCRILAETGSAKKRRSGGLRGCEMMFGANHGMDGDAATNMISVLARLSHTRPQMLNFIFIFPSLLPPLLSFFLRFLTFKFSF